MAILNFPANPSVDETYEENGVLYVWDGTKWTANSTSAFLPITGGELTGDLTVPSLNGGPLAGMRNAIINGNVIVRQRTDTTSNSYVADRWFTATAGCGTANTGPDGLGLKRVITIPAAGGFIRQAIELDNPNRQSQFYPGSTWTARVYATAAPELRLSFRKTSDDIADQSEVLAFTAMTAGATVDGFTEYTYTVTMPDETANIQTNQLKTLAIWFQTSGSASLTGMTLEPGPVATPFEHRPIGTELALCQRYFQKYSGTHYAWNNNKENESKNRIYTVSTHCTMRAIPTVTVASSANWATGPNSSSTVDIIRLGGTATSTTANNTLIDITADAEL